MNLHHPNDISPFSTGGDENRNPKQRHLYGRLHRFAMLSALFALVTGLCPGVVFSDCIVPVALWKLDEGETSTSFQETQNPDSNTANCRQDEGISICPQPEEGRYGNGQRFYTNGNHTGIDIPATPLFDWNTRTSFSITFWMKRDGTPLEENEVIIGRDSKEKNNNLHWWIGMNSQGTAMAYFGAKNVRGYKLLTDNIWHFIVFVRDGTASESRLYVDGTLERKIKFTYDTANAFTAPETDINIGWLNLSSKYCYRGVLDEIALYDVAIPEWFIRDRYHADERYPAGRTDPCD
jgi:hypothetical protein